MNTLKKDETPNDERAYPTKFEHGWTPHDRNHDAPGGNTIAPDSFNDSLGKKVPNAE